MDELGLCCSWERNEVLDWFMECNVSSSVYWFDHEPTHTLSISSSPHMVLGLDQVVNLFSFCLFLDARRLQPAPSSVPLTTCNACNPPCAVSLTLLLQTSSSSVATSSSTSVTTSSSTSYKLLRRMLKI